VGAICYVLSGPFFYVGLEYMSRRTRQVLSLDAPNKNVMKATNANAARGLSGIANAMNAAARLNAPANLTSVSVIASKKAALTLFPPPDKPKTVAEQKAEANGVPEVQLEQVDEDVETSVLLPPYIRGRSRNDLINAWKNIVSGQAFTGSYIEFYGQKWVYADKVSAVFDCDRDIQRSYNGETFMNVFLNKNGWMGGPKRQIFLKSKFSLTDVNSISGWKELQLQAKGSNDVEPDILICVPANTRNTGFAVPKPTVFIVEMKIGLGKTDSIPEHHQLCRTKKTIEKWLDDFEKVVANGKNAPYQDWVRPDVKLVFVGWAAQTPDKVVFKVPGAKVGRQTASSTPTPVPYVNQATSQVLPSYQVIKTNSEGFGKLSGVRAGFVTNIIEELNFKRAAAFYKIFAELTNNTTPLGRQVTMNRNAWLAQYGSEIGPALRSQVAIKVLMKKKAPSKPPGTIQKLSNAINKNLAEQRPVNNAIGAMLRNASTYNAAVVPALISQLKTLGATRNNWLSLRNYMFQNNSKKTSRATAILKNMTSKSVNNSIINNVFRNVYNSQSNYNTAKALAKRSAALPSALAAVKKAGGRR